mmetsp:Transcript_21655/g.74371  ORF Transcript_21655/g.74371 Transcript_21655/m.74371 type:complete len:471 (-) Transcript_21655:221-1633(-)
MGLPLPRRSVVGRPLALPMPLADLVAAVPPPTLRASVAAATTTAAATRLLLRRSTGWRLTGSVGRAISSGISSERLLHGGRCGLRLRTAKEKGTGVVASAEQVAGGGQSADCESSSRGAQLLQACKSARGIGRPNAHHAVVASCCQLLGHVGLQRARGEVSHTEQVASHRGRHPHLDGRRAPASQHAVVAHLREAPVGHCREAPYGRLHGARRDALRLTARVHRPDREAPVPGASDDAAIDQKGNREHRLRVHDSGRWCRAEGRGPNPGGVVPAARQQARGSVVGEADANLLVAAILSGGVPMRLVHARRRGPPARRPAGADGVGAPNEDLAVAARGHDVAVGHRAQRQHAGGTSCTGVPLQHSDRRGLLVTLRGLCLKDPHEVVHRANQERARVGCAEAAAASLRVHRQPQPQHEGRRTRHARGVEGDHGRGRALARALALHLQGRAIVDKHEASGDEDVNASLHLAHG